MFPHVQPTRNTPLPMIARQHRADLPRLFTVEYDYSKTKVRNPAFREQFNRKQTLWGAVWPATDANPAGSVSLSNGVFFDDLDELEEHFAKAGEYHLAFVDERI